jgi:hypothetical protein
MATAKHDYDMTVYPVQAAVRSASDGARSYTVTLPYCPCADFINRRGLLIPVDEHTMGVTICKHIAEAMARIGGWHRPDPEPKVITDLTPPAAKELLQGPEVGLIPRKANTVLRRASGHLSGTFSTLDGALVDGLVEYDRLQSRYTVTLKP